MHMELKTIDHAAISDDALISLMSDCRSRGQAANLASARLEADRRNKLPIPKCCVSFSKFAYNRAYAYWDCVPRSHRDIPILSFGVPLEQTRELVRDSLSAHRINSLWEDAVTFIETAPAPLEKLNEKSLHVFFSPFVTAAVALARQKSMPTCTRYIEDRRIFARIPFTSGEMEFVVLDQPKVAESTCLLLVEMKPGPVPALQDHKVLGQAIAELFAGAEFSKTRSTRLVNILSNGSAAFALQLDTPQPQSSSLALSEQLVPASPNSTFPSEDAIISLIAILFHGIKIAWDTRPASLHPAP